MFVLSLSLSLQLELSEISPSWRHDTELRNNLLRNSSVLQLRNRFNNAT